MSQTLPKNAKPLNQLEEDMQRRWHDLVRAEERGEQDALLETLFAKYMVALEAFVEARSKAPRQSQVA